MVNLSVVFLALREDASDQRDQGPQLLLLPCLRRVLLQHRLPLGDDILSRRGSVNKRHVPFLLELNHVIRVAAFTASGTERPGAASIAGFKSVGRLFSDEPDMLRPIGLFFLVGCRMFRGRRGRGEGETGVGLETQELLFCTFKLFFERGEAALH